jgi:hypothetical protein
MAARVKPIKRRFPLLLLGDSGHAYVERLVRDGPGAAIACLLCVLTFLFERMRHLLNSFRVLWDDGDRVFCRGHRRSANGDGDTVLLVLPALSTRHRPRYQSGLKRTIGIRTSMTDNWERQVLVMRGL